MLAVLAAETNMKFKTMDLSQNAKHAKIDPDTFIDTLTVHIRTRMKAMAYTKKSTQKARDASHEQYTDLLNKFGVLDPSSWLARGAFSYGPSFGSEEISYLCERYNLNLADTLNAFRDYLQDEGRQIPRNLKPLISIMKLIPISTAECERGFSLMNLICTDLRNRLLTINLANLMFVNLNGPPLHLWKPEKYVVAWLRGHNSADTQANRAKDVEQELSDNDRMFFDFFN